MKKNFLIIAMIAVSLVACNQQTDDPAKIKEQIFAYKEQLVEINAKITELEAQLSDNDTLSNKEGLFISADKLEKTSFKHYFEATGSVEAVNDAFISPQMGGQIKKIYVEEGSRVSKGQLLAEINSDVLQNSIVEIENGLNLATIMFQKQEELWNQNIGSEVQYLQAKSTKEGLEKSLNTLNSQLALTKVYAPFAGIVDEIYQKEGELGVPGIKLLQLVNLKEMYVNAEVSEAYISSIFVKDSVLLTFPSYPEIELKSTISQKGNVIESANRTFNIKLKITNIDEKIKPNLLAILKLKDFETPSALLVPTVVINKDINGQFLFVVEESGEKYIAKKKYVTVGQSNDESTVIESGLVEGEIVITEGFNLVKDGTVVYFNKI
jgi:RND family efflux transporter MFP subunit